MNLVLAQLTPENLRGDVYFRRDFIELHARNGATGLWTASFSHGTGITPISGSDRIDFETPWGYGGPIADCELDAVRGIQQWKARVRDENSAVAEFVRIHPFTNPMVYRDCFDMLQFNRLVVIVDLEISQLDRMRSYSDSTRNCVRKAERSLTYRRIEPSDAQLFKDLYEEGLTRNEASEGYFFDQEYYKKLLASPWCKAWMVSDGSDPIAVAAFLHSEADICHYHLSGGSPRARRANAHYLLLEVAFRHYSALGVRYMNLGGGRTRSLDDSLLQFKSKFSQLRFPFFIGGFVHDQEAYTRLNGGRTRFLCSGAVANIEVDLNGGRHREDEAVQLRPLEPENDFETLYQLRCEPNNIFWTGFDAPPNWSRLKSWFAKITYSNVHKLYMIMSAGKTIGYTYSYMAELGVETAIGVSVEATGRGLGTKAIVTMLDIMQADSTLPRTALAWIFEDNTPSIRAHEAAGYRLNLNMPPRVRRRIDGDKLQRLWTAELS